MTYIFEETILSNILQIQFDCIAAYDGVAFTIFCDFCC